MAMDLHQILSIFKIITGKYRDDGIIQLSTAGKYHPHREGPGAPTLDPSQMKPLQLRQLVLISYVVYASEECAAEYDAPIDCYECSTYTNDKYCADPFNDTYPDIRTTKCNEYCAKWVRRPKSGDQHVIRTCSTTLKIQMPVAGVCMKESRPGDGHLCFCKKGRCNSAPASSQTASKLPAILLSLLTLLLLQRFCSGSANIARWWTAVSWTLSLAVVFSYSSQFYHSQLLLGQVFSKSDGPHIGDAPALENG